MNYSYIIFGSLFTIGGLLFAIGKIHGHLAAWKKLSEEEKAKIRIVPLCRNIGEVIMLSGIIFLIKGIWVCFSDHWFLAAMIAWFVVACFDVWHIARSGKYQRS